MGKDYARTRRLHEIVVRYIDALLCVPSYIEAYISLDIMLCFDLKLRDYMTLVDVADGSEQTQEH
jgi:hypothetical protein